MTRCRAERCMDAVLSFALLISRRTPASIDVCSMVAIVHSLCSLLLSAGLCRHLLHAEMC